MSRSNYRRRLQLSVWLSLVLALSMVPVPVISSNRPTSAKASRTNLAGQKSSGEASSEPSAMVKTQAQEAYGKLGLSFEPNQGQTNEQVRFLARGSGYTLFLTATDAVFALRNSDCGSPHEDPSPRSLKTEATHSEAHPQSEICNPQSAILRMKVEGANPEAVSVGEEQLPGIVNYFIGNDSEKWHTNIPTFGRVRYSETYPGVDLVYYGNQTQLEYDFVVRPGADSQQVSLSFEGADSVAVEAATGDLLLKVGKQTITQHKPFVYQDVQGERRPVESAYEMKGGGRIGFRIGSYDRAKPLIIDPVLAYSTFLGGSDNDQGNGIAVDSAGNAYVTGQASSANFPTANAIQPTRGGNADVFVTKLNAAGSALLFSTYLGGKSTDIGRDIEVDSSGNSYVTGTTLSTDFPTTLGAFDTALGGTQDAFATKLNNLGTTLVYSTYLGGNTSETGNGIAVDSAGIAYVTGGDVVDNFGGRIFVMKVNASGALIRTTRLGDGNSSESGNAIAVDSADNIYVTGQTSATSFPIKNAIQSALSGPQDAFVAKLDPGLLLVYSTYLGGDKADQGVGIAVDSVGSAYVSGNTNSSNFPRANAFQNTFGGGLENDAFVAKLNASGSALAYSTYLGGSDRDLGLGIAVDAGGNAYVTGLTGSSDFPRANAVQDTFGGGNDAFVTKLNAFGSALAYSTYLGGSLSDLGIGIAVDAVGNAYVTGQTSSANFPVTPDTFQPGKDAGFSTFVSKIGSFSISGRVIDAGGNDIAGVTVTLSGSRSDSTTTDANGNFLFLNTTTGGNFTVTPFKAGFTFTPEANVINNLNNNQELLFIGSSPGATPTPTPALTFVISGQVTNINGGAGLAGVTITLNGSQSGTTQTDGSGNYSFNSIQGGGGYTVFPSKDGFSFNPASQSFTNLSANAFANFLGTAAPTPTPTPTPTPIPSPAPTPATFGFSAASYSIDEGAGHAQIIVTRTGDTSRAVTVEYATSDGTANDRGDFTTAIGRLRFQPGDTARSFDVFITDDVFAEGNETVNITLSNPSSGAQVGGTATTLLTIVDNDLVTSSVNPIDSTTFFVRQHYVDFFGREPDAAGLAFWTNNIESCGADAGCRSFKRTDTSAAFFLSIEFQETGFLIHRAFRASLNRFPTFSEFIRDNRELGRDVVIGQGAWEAQLEANKQAYFDEFITRAAFTSIYAGLTNAQYVDALNANTAGSLPASERNTLIAGLNGGTDTRATVLRKVAEDSDFTAREKNPAFVRAEYFGYLRRNPDDPPDNNLAGFEFWLAKLNSFGGDFRKAEMVKAFITSAEYRSRFGQP